MFQFAQRFGFDLTDTFAGHAELLAHFFQSVVCVHADAEAHAQHAFFARGQARQHAGDGFLEVGLDRAVEGQDVDSPVDPDEHGDDGRRPEQVRSTYRRR